MNDTKKAVDGLLALQRRVDAIIGMKTVIIDRGNEQALLIVSPTAVVIGEILLMRTTTNLMNTPAGTWTVKGTSSLLPNLWQDLMRLQEQG